MAWFGIRSISWFLFAAHGTPTILGVIQGKGLLGLASAREPAKAHLAAFSTEFITKIKEETDWAKAKGDDLLAAFTLPPLQVVAATVNFFALLVTGKHLFQLPLASMESILSSKTLLEDTYPRGGKGKNA
jgi:hypothetical protein